jgi:hypothetical protein
MLNRGASIIHRVSRSAAVRRLREILLYADLEFSEMVTSLAALTWGLWVLSPWVRLEGGERPVMATLSLIAPDVFWGGMAVALGVIQAIALSRDLAGVRAWVSGAAFYLWLSISILFALVNPESPHAPLYGILAFSAGWAHLRAALVRTHPGCRIKAVGGVTDL